MNAFPLKLRLLAAVWLPAAGAIVLLAGCRLQNETILYVRDAICKPAESVHLTAKLEENDWRWEDVEGKPISFWRVDGEKFQFLGGDVTDGEARGTIAFTPPAPGEYTIECQFAGTSRFRPAAFRALVLCRQPTRYGIILDIDKTLAATTIKDVFQGRFRLALPLDRDTVRVVNELAKRYELFIVTSRPRTQAPAVLEWLARNGFPRVPTFFYDPRTEALRPATAKRKIFREIKQAYPAVAVGIGDREGDIEGYMREGILAIGIGREETGAFRVSSWKEVEQLLLGTPDSRLIPSALMISHGKETAQFWPSAQGVGWQVDYAWRHGSYQTIPEAPWPTQLERLFKVITTLNSAAPQ